ncbi:hypothetical protein L226DRAFT_572399 [Lentinus tigrinus ALCF2SS1-7]|uniref:Uncharacterized protein n=1 Tax=Lentinus tigrinus ALCF2SS1-6 TaxID=1328759 RepID=A0A5C2S781_9APHY|nr:hypothetical protein L227DRAFT_504287 [Lentinus tigrinus ALCF2SS1-6]RPD73327.1 hypothetical protein L226DRAFT_572399 [Lentinus tigrinus ALCF2SS1-7]
MAILIDSSELSGLAIEGPLYGIFLCLFGVCGYDLYRRRSTGETQISWPMLVAGILLVILATARFVVDVTYLFIAFIYNETREARLAFLQDVTAQIFITKHALFITSLLVGDLFVNYRCWVVWGKNIWVVVLPVALSILAAGSGYYALWGYTHLTHQSIFAQQQPLKLFFSASLVANALATSLLAIRIWYTDRTGTHALDLEGSEHKLTPVIRIILESGLINAAFLFAFVMTLAFGSTSLEIMSEMGTPMCGIIFSIVIFRVGLRRRNRFTPRGTSGEPSMNWANAFKSFGTRTHNNRNTVVNPAVPTHGMEDSPTALRVFVQHSSTREHDDEFGSAWRGSTKPEEAENDKSSGMAV